MDKLIKADITFEADGVAEFVMSSNATEKEIVDEIFKLIRNGDFSLSHITLYKSKIQEVK